MGRYRSRRRKSPVERLETACGKVLKQIHPAMVLMKPAKRAVCQAVYWCAENIVATAFTHLRHGKATVTARELQSAIRLFIPGELAKHAISEGTKAVTKIVCGSASVPTSTLGAKKRPAMRARRMSIAAKAGLIVPPSLLRPLLDSRFRRVAKSSAVYLAAFVEYMMAEILELSGNAARNQKKKSRITSRHVYLAVVNDDELGNLFKRAVFLSGGVLPMIHPFLIPKKNAPKPKRPSKKPSKKLPTKGFGKDGFVPAKGGVKKPHRYRPGTARLREIRKQQKDTDLILSRAPFTRLTREVMQDFKDGQRIGVDALSVLQGGIESYMIDILREANLAALHARRTTVMPKDIQLVRRIRKERY
jgi:histone H3